jgi:hypothetical protein
LFVTNSLFSLVQWKRGWLLFREKKLQRDSEATLRMR